MLRGFQIQVFEGVAREVEARLDGEDHVRDEDGAAVVWTWRAGGLLGDGMVKISELMALQFVVAGGGCTEEALCVHYVVAFEAEVVA